MAWVVDRKKKVHLDIEYFVVDLFEIEEKLRRKESSTQTFYSH
jgi:hypothetical protein